MAVDFEKVLKKASDARKRREFQEELKFKEATQTTLSKALGMAGILYHLPNNLIFNIGAAERGVDPVPLTSSFVDLSDNFELRNPSLRRNRDWNRWKPALNLAGAVGLDLTTWITLGSASFTKLGKLQKLAQAMKLRPVVSKATGKLLRNEAGKVLYEIAKGNKFVKLNENAATIAKAVKDNEKVAELMTTMRDLGYLNKELPQLAGTMAEQIRQGSRGVLGFNINPFANHAQAVPLSEMQAKIVDVAGQQWAKVIEKVPGLSTALGKTDKRQVERIFRDLGHEEAANAIRDYEIAYEVAAKRYIPLAKKETKAMQKSVKAIRRQHGQPNVPVDSITGLTVKETDAMTTIYKFGDLGDNGVFEGRFFHVGKDGQPVEFFEKFENLNKKLGRGWKTKYKEVIDQVLNVSKRNKERTVKLQEYVDKVGLSKYLQKNYIKQFDILSDKALKLKKGNTSFMKGIIDAVLSEGRVWKGWSLREAEVHRNAIMHIISPHGKFSRAEKTAAALFHDQRLARTNHSVGELFKAASDPNIKSKMDDALKAGDNDLFEFYESLKTFRKDFEAAADKKNFAQIADSVKNMKAQDLFDKIHGITRRQFYESNLPALDFYSAVETEQSIAAIKSLDRIFDEGIEAGFVKIDDVGKAGKNWVKLGNSHITQVLQSKLAKNGIDISDAKEFFMKKEIYDAFGGSTLEKFISNPTEVMPQNLKTTLSNLLNSWNQFWKTITLFPFPAFHIRNQFDNMSKTLFEYLRHGDPDVIDDFRKVMKVVNSNIPEETYGKMVNVFQKMGGKIDDNAVLFKDFTGKNITARELWDIALREGFLDQGIAQYGIMHPRNAAKNMVQRLAVAGVVDPDRFKVAKKVADWANLSKAARGVMNVGYINAMYHMGEHAEYGFRLQNLMLKMKKMPFEDAIKETALVTIDYANLSKFEKDFLAKIFPFYSFQKGAMKYAANRMYSDPLLKSLMRGIETSEEIFTDPDERINRGLLPEYLNEASLRVGLDNNGKFRVVNLRGLTSLAELVNFAMPVDAALQSIFPHFKSVFEIYANKHFYFKSPLEKYPGQKVNILGIPTERRGLPAAILKNIRAVGMTEKLIESVLHSTGSKYSIFGTDKKRAWFGKGRISTKQPEPISTFFLKGFMGIPIATVDTDKALRNKWFYARKEIDDLKRGRELAKKELRNDPEARRKETRRLTNEIIKQITMHSASKVNFTSEAELPFRK
jgi:hypothetical protein